MPFTPDQEKAIQLEGKDILVSASAGSGKTTVLVARVLRKIMAGISIDHLLIVTFTKAAAAEMKTRIKQHLVEQLKTKPSAYLQEQLNLVDTANISTIDAFCLEVIKRFYYVIDLDPSFSILTDETQRMLLEQRALKEAEADFIDKKEFKDFYDNFAGDRNADNARQLLLDLYDYALTKPNYKDWLNQLPRAYDNALTNGKLFQEKIKPYLQKVLSAKETELEKILANPFCQTKELAKMQQSFADFTTQLKIFLASLKQNCSYDILRKQLQQCVFTGRYAKSSKWDDNMLDFYQACQEIKNETKVLVFDCYSKFFAADSQEMKLINQKGSRFCKTIVKAENMLINHFEQLKAQAGFLDFSDLEQKAASILSQDTSEAELARNYYQNKFSEILVDEYQDINPLQESILRQLKCSNNHLFMVGDIKQSIYGFRQAAPDLFLKKYHDFATKDDCSRLILHDNFRSTQNVIGAVNHIFTPIMTTDFGGIDYRKEGQLHFGASYYPALDSQNSEFIFQEKQKAAVSQDQDEIKLIINRIHDLQKQNFQIYDTSLKSLRPIKYSDIAILTRSRSDNLEIMQDFSDAGIPLFLNDVQNYFQTFELTIMLNYLKIIDNPDQDIPLVSVLRSPIFGFDERELAQIRIRSKNTSFYSALTNYVSYHDDLSSKIKSFLNKLEDLRDFAINHRISELVWEIYEQTDLLEIMTAMPNGEQRRVNLEALYERADQFESAGFKGLYRFISFISRVREEKRDLAQPLVSKDATNSVHLMTIHGAKGLEFPLVFYLGLDHQFRLKDLTGDYLIAGNILGLTIKLAHYKVDSWQKSWNEVERYRQMLEEESRIMYVATTRAQQKLIMIAAIKNSDKQKKQWAQSKIDGILPLYYKLNARSPLSLIGPSLDFNEDKPVDKQKEQMQVIREENHAVGQHPDASKNVSEEINPLLTKTAAKLFDFEYPFNDAVKTASYQSVSEIKQLLIDPDEEKLANAHLISSQNRYLQNIDTKPQFLYQTKFTGAQIGTAMHLILQYFDYSANKNMKAINQEVQELIKKEKLQQEIVPSLKLDQILWFVQNDFTKNFSKYPENLHREEDFSSLIAASRLYPHFSDPNSKILVHGTIDGYYAAPDGISLFDYKTDYVDLKHKKEAIAAIKHKYREQLSLYEAALNSYSGKKVKHKYLILLSAKEIVELTD